MSSRNALAVIVNTGGSPDNLFLWSGKDNTHWHDYDGVTLTNRTGAGLVAGDVVRWANANDSSVAINDTAGSRRPFVVAMATIADTVAGEFARSGRVLAKSTGTINVAEFVRKSATAKAIESIGVGTAVSIPDTAIGFAVGASSGGFTMIQLFPFTFSKTNNLAASSGTDQVIANTAAETDITGSSFSVLANALATAAGSVTIELAGVLSGEPATATTNKVIVFRCRLGATALLSVTVGIARVAGGEFLSAEPFEIRMEVTGHGATNSQRGWLRYQGRQVEFTGGTKIEVTPAVTRGIGAEDSTTALTLKATAQFSAAAVANSVTIEKVRVVMPPS